MKITRRQLRRIILQEIDQINSGQIARLRVSSNWIGQSILDNLFGEDGQSIFKSSSGDIQLEKVIGVDGDSPGGFDAEIKIDTGDADLSDINVLEDLKIDIFDEIADMATQNPEARFDVDIQWLLVD
jgi:hypothetical protein|tara:strand:- start:62 stop:442 length:381 start_codon:yes stop_codon:yes gene_type:complete